jgi:tryptophan synthase beta chain
LDYPGVGPEHSYYADKKIAQYIGVDDSQALEAFKKLSEIEGIIPALETAHAIYYTMQLAPKMSKEQIIVVNLSGRGDKDVNEAMRVLDELAKKVVS